MATTTMAEKKGKDDVIALETDPSAATALEVLGGALAVSTFLVTWLASLASPLLLALSLHRGYHSLSAVIIFVTILAYAPWEHGAISLRFQAFLNRYHALYYDGVSIVFEGGEVPSSSSERGRQTFFAVHPHGAFCIGWALLYHNPLMRNVRFCFAPALYASPMFRLFSRMANRPGSAKRSAMDGYLRGGEDVALPPGGFEEATLASAAQDRVFIKKRYGFVRLCLKHGVAIRPVYAFGEGRLYDNAQGLWSARLALNRFGVPTILVWGLWCLPLLPKRGVKMHVVVGRPLVVPKIESPTKEEVASWHGRYILELRRIYDEHKEAAYGAEKGKEAKLEVW